MFAVDAYETKQAIRKALTTMEFSSLPAVMKTAQDLAKKVDSLTNYELASLVNKDPFALAKVMDIANRGCRSDNLAVTKIEDAVLKVGFRKVRNMVFSLLDMEAAKAKLRYHEQGETAAYALCSCVISEKIMREVGRLDPQEVYTVTVLRSYGQQLMSAFMIHYYREAVLQIPEKGEDAAFRAVFGITPLDLTLELLRETKVPREILRGLRPFDPEWLELQFLPDCDELIIYSEFSLRLTSLIFNYELKAEEFEKQATELLEYFRAKVYLREDQMFRIVDELGDMIAEYKTKYKIEPLTKGMNGTIKARVKDKDPPPPPPKEPDPDDPEDIDHRLHKNPELIMHDSAREIAWFASKRPPEMEEIYNSLLKGFHKGLAADHVVIFEREPDATDYVCKIGVGEIYESIVKDQIAVNPSLRDIFGVCLSRQYNALIYDTGETAARPFLPKWFSAFNCNSVMVLPVWNDIPDPDEEEEEGEEGEEKLELPTMPGMEEENMEPFDREPFMLIMVANSNGQTAIQLKNTMSTSIVGMKRQLIKTRIGHALPPAFMTAPIDPSDQLDLGQFMREARRALLQHRKRSGGVTF